jgi:hypothetical protein
MGHPLNQSALYHVTTRLKLAKQLALTPAELEQACRHGGYSDREIITKNGKRRRIQEPRGVLRKIHGRAALLLSRIEAPQFLYCPVKGRSYVTNAKRHAEGKEIRKLDIQSYFDSTPRRRVYWFFHSIMHCAPDVSAILARLLTVNDHLATGSPASPILSFYAFYDMWQNIANLSAQHGFVMTVYMDDITLSGETIPERYMWEIRKAIVNAGLRYHKERRFIGETAEVTGVVLRSGEMLLPNRQHRKAHALREQLRNVVDLEEKIKAERQLRGLLSQRHQVEARHPGSGVL